MAHGYTGSLEARPTILLAHPSPDLYGSDRMLLESVRALNADWRVVVTVPGDGPLCPLLRDAGAEVVVLPVPVLRKAYLRPAGLLRLAAEGARALPAAISLLRRERAGVLYVNTITLPFWLLAGRLARRRVLCHVHEAEDGGPAPVRAALYLPLRLAHLVVANSKAAVTAMGRFGGNRVEVIYNGVEEPAEPVPPVRADLGEPVRLVLIGRLSPRKGSDLAVKAVQLLRGRGHKVELTLVGSVFPGYEWYERELRALADEPESAGAVTFAGFRDQPWESYAAADIAVVPSRVEPFGLVAVEALLAGRPLVAAAAQGLAEIVRDGDNGVLVAPDDAVALADGIERVLTGWPAAVARIDAARRDAGDRFGKGRYYRNLRKAVGSLSPTGPSTGTVPSLTEDIPSPRTRNAR